MLRSSMLTRMRLTAEKFLTDTCVIERPYNTPGRYMTPNTMWVQIGQPVKCRMILPGQALNTSGIRQAGEQETLTSIFRLALPRGTDIQADDQVTHNGTIYTVVRLATELTDEFFEMAILTVQQGADIR